MAEDLPQQLRFAVDLGDEDQQLRILDSPCPPAQPLQRSMLPTRLPLKFAEGG
jgi:hypothetical protein